MDRSTTPGGAVSTRAADDDSREDDICFSRWGDGGTPVPWVWDRRRARSARGRACRPVYPGRGVSEGPETTSWVPRGGPDPRPAARLGGTASARRARPAGARRTGPADHRSRRARREHP
ncbi:hypothetical protein GCM10022241_20410 [Micrococcus endophyticus]